MIKLTLLCILICAAGLFSARSYLAKHLTPAEISKMVSDGVGRKVTIGNIEFSKLYGIILQDVDVYDSAAQSFTYDTMFHTSEVKLSPSFLHLLKGDIVFSTISISNTELHLAKNESDSWNLVSLFDGLHRRGRNESDGPRVKVNDVTIFVHTKKEAPPNFELKVPTLIYNSNTKTVSFDVSKINKQFAEMKGLFDNEKQELGITFEHLPAFVRTYLPKRFKVKDAAGKIALTLSEAKDAVIYSGDLTTLSIELPIVPPMVSKMETLSLADISGSFQFDNRRWKVTVKKGSLSDRQLSKPTFDFYLALSGIGNQTHTGRLSWTGDFHTFARTMSGESNELAALIELRGPTKGTIDYKSSGRSKGQLKGHIIHNGTSFPLDKIPGIPPGSAKESIHVSGLHGKTEFSLPLPFSGKGIFKLQKLHFLVNKDPLDASGVITLSKGSSPQFNLSIKAPHIDGRPLTKFLPDPLRVSGPLGIDIELKGRNIVTGQIVFKGTKVAIDDTSVFHNTRGELSLHKDRMVLSELQAELSLPSLSHSNSMARLSVSGEVPTKPRGKYSISAHATLAHLENFSAFLPEGFSAAGRARNISLRVSGTKNHPQISGKADLQGATIRPAFLASDLKNMHGHVIFSNDQLSFEKLAFQTGASQMTISGGVKRFAKPIFTNVHLQAGTVYLNDLVGVLQPRHRPFPPGSTFGGKVVISSLKINGPLEKAKWHGVVTLKDASASLMEFSKGIQQMNGRLEFTGSTMTADGISSRFGSSKSRIEGTLRLYPPYDMDLHVAFANADIGELYAAIPGTSKSDLAVTGKGSLAAQLKYRNSELSINGSIVDGRLKSFGFPIQHVNGKFTYSGVSKVLKISDIVGEWAGGKATGGKLTLAHARSAPYFTASASLSGCRLEKIVGDLGLPSRRYKGIAGGYFEVQGVIGNKESLKGSGEIEIRRAHLPQFEPLQRLSRSLRLDFFSKDAPEKVNVTFTIDDSRITTSGPSHISIRGRDYALNANGYTNFDGIYRYAYQCGVKAGLAGTILTALPTGLEKRGNMVFQKGSVKGKFTSQDKSL